MNVNKILAFIRVDERLKMFAEKAKTGHKALNVGIKF